MKKSRSFFLVFIMSLAALFSGTALANKNNLPNLTPPDEFEILVKYLENNSILISNDALPIINADEVKKNLKNPKYHIIDIRNDSWFEYGHIKGAQNLKSEELLNYFENSITPKDFEKIILVCYSGQSASYFSGLLNIAGYDNVYSMKWGMSSWREDFAEGYWEKNIGNDYESQLETVENTKTEAGVQPTLNTGNSEGKDILHARLTELFKNPYRGQPVANVHHSGHHARLPQTDPLLHARDKIEMLPRSAASQRPGHKNGITGTGSGSEQSGTGRQYAGTEHMQLEAGTPGQVAPHNGRAEPIAEAYHAFIDIFQ